MKMKNTKLLSEAVNAIQKAIADAKTAKKSDASAGQKVAWFVACSIHSGDTIDEAFTSLKDALIEKGMKAGEATSKANCGRSLVGHAYAIRKKAKSDTFPKGADWHSVLYYKRIEELAKTTASLIVDDWANTHKSVIDKTKVEGIPFSKHFCQKYGVAPSEIMVSAWDRDFLKVTKQPSKGAKESEASLNQLIAAFRTCNETCRNALAALTQSERSRFVGVIETVNNSLR